MSTPDHVAGAPPGSTSLLTTVWGRVIGRDVPVYRLTTDPGPILDLDVPSELTFFIGRDGNRVPSPNVQAGDEIEVGQVLFTDRAELARPSPYRGKVTGVRTAPDVTGGKAGLALAVEPAHPPGGPAFPALDSETASLDALHERIREAAVLTAEPAPRPLAERLNGAETLVVLAADREPGLGAVTRLLRDRPDDAARAAALLGRLAGARQTLLAVTRPIAGVAESACAPHGVRVLVLAPEYPATLEPMVARSAGAPDAVVLSLETALTAFDSVVEGRLQDNKVLTVIGPDGTAKGNYRVPLGARIGDVLTAIGVRASGQDKVVAGGPMRGFAQYSVDAAVDTSFDGIAVLRPESIVPWSDEPCVNCGACIDACPARLQVQLIGRYSEFSLFERTREYHIDACIECGLCAAVCTARRPLVQFIRLAKRELAKSDEAPRGNGS